MRSLLLLLLATLVRCCVANILYPMESESRELRTLHGLWNFKISPPYDQLVGFNNKWYSQRFETVSKYINIYKIKHFLW